MDPHASQAPRLTTRWWVRSSMGRVLLVALALMLVGRVPAQTFKTLHSFSGGSDGGWPSAGLILSDDNLYGSASDGGHFGYGTMFAAQTDGTGFTHLHSFSGLDGASPRASPLLSGNTLYGTAYTDQFPSDGVVFGVDADGTGFTVLHAFDGSSDGRGPNGKLTLSGNTLYGTAGYGGSSNAGTVFALSTNGTGFRIL